MTLTICKHKGKCYIYNSVKTPFGERLTSDIIEVEDNFISYKWVEKEDTVDEGWSRDNEFSTSCDRPDVCRKIDILA